MLKSVFCVCFLLLIASKPVLSEVNNSFMRQVELSQALDLVFDQYLTRYQALRRSWHLSHGCKTLNEDGQKEFDGIMASMETAMSDRGYRPVQWVETWDANAKKEAAAFIARHEGEECPESLQNQVMNTYGTVKVIHAEVQRMLTELNAVE